MRAVLALFVQRSGPHAGRVRWGRVLAAFGVIVGGAALLSAGGAWGWLRFQRGITAVSWTDVALPTRWPALRVKIGEHFLGEAREHVAKREFSTALAKYRAGLSRSPGNVAARLELAELYLAYRRPDLAKQLLLDRLAEFADEPGYLQRCLQFLFEFQADQELLAITEELLRRKVGGSQPALYAATLAFHRGDYDRAESLIRGYRLETAPDGLLLLARVDLERGFPELAAERVSALLNAGFNQDDAYTLLAHVHRRLGQTRDLETAAALRLAAHPLSHLPRLDFLHLRHERGDRAGLDREIDTYFAHFAEDQIALLALGDFAANKGLVSLAERIEAHFRAKAWPADPAMLMAAEAQLAAGDYAGGLARLRAHMRLNTPTTDRAAPVFDSLQAIALFGLQRADEAQVHLERLLAQPNLRAENLQAIASRLLALDQPQQAHAVLARAVALDPLNQPALTELIRLHIRQNDLAALPAHTRQLLAMRRPSPAVLDAVRVCFGSDRQLFHPDQLTLLAEIDRATAPRSLSRR